MSQKVTVSFECDPQDAEHLLHYYQILQQDTDLWIYKMVNSVLFLHDLIIETDWDLGTLSTDRDLKILKGWGWEPE